MKTQAMKAQTMKSITENGMYTQALSDLIVLSVETANIPEDLGEEKDFEANPEWTAAEEAKIACWKSLAAIIDAHCARL